MICRIDPLSYAIVIRRRTTRLTDLSCPISDNSETDYSEQTTRSGQLEIY